MTAQTTTYHKAESFLFSFKENSDMFLADYGDNAYQLERMGRLLDAPQSFAERQLPPFNRFACGCLRW